MEIEAIQTEKQFKKQELTQANTDLDHLRQ